MQNDVVNTVASIVDDFLSPVVGGGTDGGTSPLDWAFLAMARREFLNLFDIRSGPTTLKPARDILPFTTSQLAEIDPTGLLSGRGLSGSTLVGDPVVVLDDGIITGTVTVTGSDNPLTFTPAGSPTQQAKVSVINLSEEVSTFTYLPQLSMLQDKGTGQFDVLVTEETPFDQFLIGIIDQPDAQATVRSVLIFIHEIPLVSTLLSPLIGGSTVVPVSVDLAELVPDPEDTPVAYTYRVTSFDGTPISINFFPAPQVADGEANTAATIMTTAGLSSPGNIDAYSEWDSSIIPVHLVPGIAPLRDAGYNVLTWDSRGKGESGGVLELGTPEFEGQDARAIIDYVADQGWTTDVVVDGKKDPVIGMVGGSYGGGMELIDAAIDERVDAIAPGIAWNSLETSLYPNQQFNTLWGTVLPAALLTSGADINPQIYLATVTGVLFNWISPTAQRLLARSGPGEFANDITAATLLLQGAPDTIFPLREANVNARYLDANGIPVKMIWYCGGHGACLNPVSPIQDDLLLNAQLMWMDKYLRGGGDADNIPTFQYVDQYGDFYASDLLPFDPDFQGTPLVTESSGGGVLGGFLPIVPIIGGGGINLSDFPVSLLATTKALNAVTLDVPSEAETVQIVGTPELEVTYRGIGTTRYVYAQIVDNDTGQVVGTAVTPVNVTLDGSDHTVYIPMEDIVYTMRPGSSLTLQLTNGAIPYEDLTSFGGMQVSNIKLTLPTVGDGVATPVTSV